MWDLVQKFDFEQHSLIKVELEYVRNTCNSISNGAGTKFLWLNLAVIDLSIAYMILTFNYFLSIMSRFRHIRELHKLQLRLFALMNGDSITEVNHRVTFSKFLLGNFYMYSFVFISIW